MAVQVKYPDDTRQWLPGTFYAGRFVGHDADGFACYSDGFTVRSQHHHRDFGSEVRVISLTCDSDVVEWRRLPLG